VRVVDEAQHRSALRQLRQERQTAREHEELLVAGSVAETEGAA
jgi:hypothetical protein